MREGGSGSAPGAAVVATVKWFNPVKGFGFLTPVDDSPDIFCHVSAVARAGFDTLPEGATVTCEVEQGRQGVQVWQIHAVDTSTASPARSGVPPRRDYGHVHGERAPASGRRVVAMVKWFNPAKGFGFLVPDDGSPDVFCHASAVRDAGYDTLPEGATVTCEVAEGGRGPAVTPIVAVDDSTAMAEPAGRFEPDRDRPGRRWDRDVPAGPVEDIASLARGYPYLASRRIAPTTALRGSARGQRTTRYRAAFGGNRSRAGTELRASAPRRFQGSTNGPDCASGVQGPAVWCIVLTCIQGWSNALPACDVQCREPLWPSQGPQLRQT